MVHCYHRTDRKSILTWRTRGFTGLVISRYFYANLGSVAETNNGILMSRRLSSATPSWNKLWATWMTGLSSGRTVHASQKINKSVMCRAAVGRGELSMPRLSYPTLVVHATHLMFVYCWPTLILRTALICAGLHLLHWSCNVPNMLRTY